MSVLVLCCCCFSSIQIVNIAHVIEAEITRTDCSSWTKRCGAVQCHVSDPRVSPRDLAALVPCVSIAGGVYGRESLCTVDRTLAREQFHDAHADVRLDCVDAVAKHTNRTTQST